MNTDVAACLEMWTNMRWQFHNASSEGMHKNKECNEDNVSR